MASSRISHLFALIALASSVLPLAPLAAGADEAPKRSISLTATGAIRTSPDKVDITTESRAKRRRQRRRSPRTAPP